MKKMQKLTLVVLFPLTLTLFFSIFPHCCLSAFCKICDTFSGVAFQNLLSLQLCMYARNLIGLVARVSLLLKRTRVEIVI
jgi:hypothetical protein